MNLFHSTNARDRIVNEFIIKDCSRGESIADILHRSSKPFCFGEHFIQRQQITIETDDTTEILASKLIEKLSYNVSTGLYVLFDVKERKIKTCQSFCVPREQNITTVWPQCSIVQVREKEAKYRCAW